MAAPAPNRPLVDRHVGLRRYFRRWNKLERWKWGLSAVAFIVGLGWLAAAPFAKMLGRPNTDERYTHGPLANPHAAWEANCAMCHPKHSMKEFGWDIWKADERWNTGFEETCVQCHAGPRHFDPDHWPGGQQEGTCNSCHHDHNGKEFSLTRLSDSDCTRCHREDLPKFHGREPGNYTNFATSHAEFEVRKNPPARSMKFSHSLHMAMGLTTVNPPGNDRVAVRVKDQPRYKQPGQRENDLVQLTCASCHSLDNETKGNGAYFLPVTFEKNCQSCHFLGSIGDGKEGHTPLEIPHHRQPEELRKLIEGTTALDLGIGSPELDGTKLPFVRQQPEQPKTNPNVGRLKEMTNARTKIVEANCRKCHDFNDNHTIKPVSSPAIWFPNARFNHASHKALLGQDPASQEYRNGCSACHSVFDSPVSGMALVERENLNLPGIDTCRICHGPLGGSKEKPGGVRFGCTDCHSYHNGEHPLQGRGANAWNPLKPAKSPIDFLIGKPDKP